VSRSTFDVSVPTVALANDLAMRRVLYDASLAVVDIGGHVDTLLRANQQSITLHSDYPAIVLRSVVAYRGRTRLRNLALVAKSRHHRLRNLLGRTDKLWLSVRPV